TNRAALRRLEPYCKSFTLESRLCAHWDLRWSSRRCLSIGNLGSVVSTYRWPCRSTKRNFRRRTLGEPGSRPLNQRADSLSDEIQTLPTNCANSSPRLQTPNSA